MKWRNQLLAFVCLSPSGSGRHLFSTLGHPKALRHYLICRRGAVACKTGAYSHYAAGAGTRLNVDSMPYAALVMNYSKDFAAPDQAAAATAIATGERVTNRAIAINGEGKPSRASLSWRANTDEPQA
jgi:Alkaline phosphatase